MAQFSKNIDLNLILKISYQRRDYESVDEKSYDPKKRRKKSGGKELIRNTR